MEVVASLSQGRTAAAQCGLFTHKSVPVIFEPPCTYIRHFMPSIFSITISSTVVDLQLHLVKKQNHFMSSVLPSVRPSFRKPHKLDTGFDRIRYDRPKEICAANLTSVLAGFYYGLI